MSNLITSGVSLALISADSYSKFATKPMSMAARELAKANPDVEYVKRTMSYGVKELGKAEESAAKAQEELEKAQEIVNAEEKSENEARLNEPKPTTPVEEIAYADRVTDKIVVDVDSSSKPSPKVDTIEISADAMSQLASNQSQKVAIDLPKIYTPNTGVAVLDIAPESPKLNAKA